MKPVDPVNGVTEQVVGDLGTREVVNGGIPVRVAPPIGVGILVKRGAVEQAEPVWLLGEMVRDPVGHHTDPRTVAGVYQVAEVIGRAKTAGGRIEGRRQVAEGVVIGMLGNRQQGDVGETEVRNILHKLVGQLAVGEIAVILLGLAPPRAQVDLIKGKGRVGAMAFLTAAHPAPVAPLELPGVLDHRSKPGRALGEEGVGVGLDRRGRTERTLDLVFVERAGGHTGEENLPHATVVAPTHPMAATVPAIEVPHHRHVACVWRPHGKRDAVHLFHLGRVSAENLVAGEMFARSQRVGISVRDHRRETVGIVDVSFALGSGNPQAVRERRPGIRDRADEEALVVDLLELGDHLTAAGVQDLDAKDVG